MITCYFENKNKAYLRHITVNAIVIKDSQVSLGHPKGGEAISGENLVHPEGV